MMTKSEEEQFHQQLKIHVYASTKVPAIGDLALAVFYVLTRPGMRSKRTKEEQAMLDASERIVATKLRGMLKAGSQ